MEGKAHMATSQSGRIGLFFLLGGQRTGSTWGRPGDDLGTTWARPGYDRGTTSYDVGIVSETYILDTIMALFGRPQSSTIIHRICFVC